MTQNSAPCTCSPSPSQPVREMAYAMVALAFGPVPDDKLCGVRAIVLVSVVLVVGAAPPSCAAASDAAIASSSSSLPPTSDSISSVSGQMISGEDDEDSNTYWCIMRIISGAATASDSMR